MKKIVAIAITVLVTMSFVACNSDSSKASKESDKTTGQEQTEETKAPEEKQESNDDEKQEDDLSKNKGKDHMVAMGTANTATFENIDKEKYSISLCVNDIYRGDEALAFINDKMLAQKKMFKAEKPKESGQEYMVVKLTYKLLSYDGGDTRKVPQIKAHKKTYEAYPFLIAAGFFDKENGYPDLSMMETKVGEETEGYVIFQIDKENETPYMSCNSFLADYSDGIWFQLYK